VLLWCCSNLDGQSRHPGSDDRCRVTLTNYVVNTEIDSPNNIPNVQYTICEADCIIKSNSRRTFVTSVKTALARSRQMRCRSVRFSAKIASDDLLSSIPLLNFSKISDKIAASFGGSTLYHRKAAKRLPQRLDASSTTHTMDSFPVAEKKNSRSRGPQENTLPTSYIVSRDQIVQGCRV
jgi:hypothetical protein